jgi:PTS system nitrogen regulatory IIA component
MDVAKILSPSNVICQRRAGSKKHVLDLLSQSLAKAIGDDDHSRILDALVTRERLGTTALGNAVAMPHSRIEGIRNSVGAFLKLDEPVDFDAPDDLPVDMFFALLVPEDTSGQHLEDMQDIIRKLQDSALRELLHDTNEPQEIYGLLTDSLSSVQRRIVL